MSDTYTKLFRSIAASTIVSEPLATRWLWVTLLSQADKSGNVYGSIPGLARLANITIQEVEAGLDNLMSPDPYSRTKDNEGRRLEAFDGGWRLLNHGKYAAMRDEAERAEYKREWDRKNRPSGHARQSDKSPTVRQDSDRSPSKSVQSDAPDPTNTNTNTNTKHQEQKQQHVQPTAARSRFDEFWRIYPNKKGKQEAEKTWRRRKLDHLCDELILHVALMESSDDAWRRGFIPMGSTYLNQARWEDVPSRPARDGPVSNQSRTLTAIQTLQAMKHGNLDSRRDSGRTEQAALPVAGTLPCR